MATNLYEACIEAKLEIDHHESDLYIQDCPESRALLKQYNQEAIPFQSDLSDSDGEAWLDVPFEYQPFWEAKTRVGNG